MDRRPRLLIVALCMLCWISCRGKQFRYRREGERRILSDDAIYIETVTQDALAERSLILGGLPVAHDTHKVEWRLRISMLQKSELCLRALQSADASALVCVTVTK